VRDRYTCGVSTLDRAREAMTAELTAAFADRDRVRVEAAATWLRRTGTPLIDIYDRLLAATTSDSSEYATSPGQHLERFQVQELLRHLRSTLGTSATRPDRGQVALVVEGERRHVFGLTPLLHVLEDAGYTPVAAPGLTLHDVEGVLDSLDDPVGVVLALNDPTVLPRARQHVARVRAHHPRVRVIVAGYAAEAVTDLAVAVGAHSWSRRYSDTLRVLDEATNPLSPRELAVLGAVARGMSNPDAGQHLGVAAATVKTHLDRVFAKLGTSDRTATVAMAMRRGWID
jgi:DNA-binding CsgD family transcriptional regulator